MAENTGLSDSFGKAAMWVIGGLASCMLAHAIMIPTGMEQWLHTTFSAPATPDIAASVDQILEFN